MEKLTKWNLRFLTSLIIALICTNIAAQSVIKGTVKDGQGEPIPSASIQVKGSTVGTFTNVDGKFSIEAKSQDILVVSFLGMSTAEIKVGEQTFIAITMEEDFAMLDEVIAVGYGVQRRGSLTSAISTVSDKELLKAPTMSMSNVVGARVAGVAALQTSGQPGSDYAILTMRGQGSIVYVIDGVRRSAADFNGLDPNEIESVSVLKDASAVAVYGLDANGAFIVTTKKGSKDRMSISYTGSYGWSQNAEQQQWLDGPGYAYWHNKARELQGDPLIFNKEMVQNMIDGTNGWGNTNWYEMIFGTGWRTHHNVSASGGNDRISFFTSLGYLREDGNIDKFDYDRYNLRANIDAKLSKSLTFQLGLSGRIEKRNSAAYSADPNAWHNITQQIIRAMPYAQPTREIDGKTYNVSTPTNSSDVAPLASLYDAGYSRSSYSYVQSNFSLQYDAPWLKGLSVKFLGAYDMTINFAKVLGNRYEVAAMSLPNPSTKELIYDIEYDPRSPDIRLTESSSRASTFTTQSSVSYDNKFGKHSVAALFLAETRQSQYQVHGMTGYGLDFIQLDELDKITNKSGGGTAKYPAISGHSSMSKVAGFVGRLNYNYAERYYLEFSFRHDGSYLFGGMNKRWITLPGISAAWRINNEPWFNASWVESLKLRAGIGKTATSNVNPFQWRNTMGISKNQVIIGNMSQSMMYASTLGNPNLTWAQCLNYNVGVDATMWRGLLGVEFDVFYKYEYDLLSGITGAYAPSRGGYYFTSANVNECDYKGFDITLTHYNNISDFTYGAKLIWSYAYGRWLKFAGDPENAPEYQRLTGKQIGTKYGFIADGLFRDQDDIDNSPTIPGKPVRPGYIKYIDRNGDGVITYDQDMGYVGKSAIPTHTGSLNLFANWRGFDIDLLVSWGLGSTVALTGVYTSVGSEGIMDNTGYTKPFYHGGNSPVFLVENCWRPDNLDAEFPRLEIDNVSSNNAFSSTLWYRNGNYMRLKTAQLGYNFPKRWLRPAGIQALRLYVEGYNLLTFSGLTKYNIDPESPAVNNGYYPQQRTYTLGVKITF